MTIGRTSRILQSKPNQWINQTNSNSISANIAFQNLGSITATGTSGATSLTASSSVGSLMFSGQQFRLGSDIYTASSISGTTINIVGTLSTNYSAVQIQIYKDSAIWDSSGNSRNATQATAGNQPVPYSSINGRNALFFNGVDTVALTPDTVALDPESGGFSIFFVYKSRNNTSGRHLVAKGALNSSTQGWAIVQNGGTNAYVSIVTRPSPPAFNVYSIPFIDDLTPSILCLTFDGSTATLYRNGVSIGSVSYVGSVIYTAGSGSIGARFNATTFAALDFGELIQWKRLLSDTERNMITIELGKKWGIATPEFPSSPSYSVIANQGNTNAFQNLGTITASGTSGASSLTASSSVANLMYPRQVFMLGSDTYTVSSISGGTTIYVFGTLSTNYSAVQIQCLKVSQLNDLTGAGDNAVQATVANQPAYIASSTVMNYRPAIGFNSGSSLDSLLVSPANAANSNIWDNGGTLITVYNAKSLTGNARICSKEPSAGGGWVLFNQQSNANKLQFNVRFTSGDSAWILVNADNPVNTILIVAITYNGSSVSNDPTFYINSLTPKAITRPGTPTGTIVNDSATQFNIGNIDTLVSPLNGTMGELHLFKRILSSAELSNAFNSLAIKYGVTLT